MIVEFNSEAEEIPVRNEQFVQEENSRKYKEVKEDWNPLIKGTPELKTKVRDQHLPQPNSCWISFAKSLQLMRTKTNNNERFPSPRQERVVDNTSPPQKLEDQGVSTHLFSLVMFT